MLDGLDQVEWSNISHAFGPATDVPWLLRAVAGSDQAARDAAMPELWGTIWHQGTVYEATASAVPFLARIARQAAMPDSDRAMLVALLGAIAAGWSFLEVHAGYLPTTSVAVDELALAREMDGVAAARAAVGREAPALIADLGGTEGRTDWRLSALAAQVAESAVSAAPLVERMKGRTDNPRLRAALDLTTAMLAGVATPAVVDAAAAALDPDGTERAIEMTKLNPERRARIVADCLYEDGFDETHIGA